MTTSLRLLQRRCMHVLLRMLALQGTTDARRSGTAAWLQLGSASSCRPQSCTGGFELWTVACALLRVQPVGGIGSSLKPVGLEWVPAHT